MDGGSSDGEEATAKKNPSVLFTYLLRRQGRGEAPLKDALLDRVAHLSANVARHIPHLLESLPAQLGETDL